MVADGLTEGQLIDCLFQLSLIGKKATLLFDVAHDREAADVLRRKASLFAIEAQMFGKVEQAAELWAASDIVVARGHSYVEARALALRLPLIHLLPKTDAAQHTARIYAERGIGLVVDHLATLAAQIDLQLMPHALEQSRKILGQLTKRTAASDVARLVAQVAAQAEQILKERAQGRDREASPAAFAPSSLPQEDAAQPARPKGPLEAIGGPALNLEDPQAAVHLEAAALEDWLAAELSANQQVQEQHKEVERWERMAQLATEKGDVALSAEASRRADTHRQAMHRALAELARLADRRQALDPPNDDQGERIERTFRQMEVEDALAELKRRLGKA
jgi:hypothetical protein